MAKAAKKAVSPFTLIQGTVRSSGVLHVQYRKAAPKVKGAQVPEGFSAHICNALLSGGQHDEDSDDLAPSGKFATAGGVEGGYGKFDVSDEKIATIVRRAIAHRLKDADFSELSPSFANTGRPYIVLKHEPGEGLRLGKQTILPAKALANYVSGSEEEEEE